MSQLSILKIKAITLLATTILAFPVAGFAQSAGATPTLTWRATSYIPGNYSGKTLPILGTPVTVALGIINNGRIADLSSYQIRWFLNNYLFQEGRGLKTITFTISGPLVGDQNIKAVVLDYPGEGNLSKTISIPVVSPKVVIEAPFPNFLIRASETIRALPYFFNVQNIGQLVFDWSANGRQTTGAGDTPDLLELKTTGGVSGSKIALGLIISNPLSALERAGSQIMISLR